VIANFLIVVGILVALTPVLDLLMSESQKRVLEQRVLSAWNWLDDLKKVSLVGWLRNRVVQVLLGFIALAVAALWMYFFYFEIMPVVEYILGYENPVSGETVDILLYLLYASFALMTAFALWAGPKLIKIILRPTKARQVFSRAFVIGAFIFSPWILIFLPFELADALVSVLVVWLYGATLLTVYWAAATLPLLFAYTTTTLRHFSELVVRRIAEYPKGPTIAFGVVSGAIGGLIKAFS
jgi:hypothetical protein